MKNYPSFIHKPNNDDGPIDVTHSPSEKVVAVSDYYNLPIGVVAEELSKAVDKLEDLKARGFKGDGCEYCDDPKDGVCLFNGCLTLEDLEDKFNQDIEELSQETENLVTEIEEWQT